MKTETTQRPERPWAPAFPSTTAGSCRPWARGVRSAFLRGDSLWRLDMGGPVRFTAHLGLAFHPLGGLGVGYRFERICNASLHESNPGLDSHMFGLSYRF